MNVTGLLHTMNSPELLENIISQHKTLSSDSVDNDFGFNSNNITEINIPNEHVQVKESINPTREFEIEPDFFSIDLDCDFSGFSDNAKEEVVKPMNYYF